jgi:hypothetical protein
LVLKAGVVGAIGTALLRLHAVGRLHQLHELRIGQQVDCMISDRSQSGPAIWSECTEIQSARITLKRSSARP